ncbi:MAG: hypothetical protein JWO06_2905 [Bacteroidota bacterium]|nr:hypothetical protein [Bacteroidota bacterium]
MNRYTYLLISCLLFSFSCKKERSANAAPVYFYNGPTDSLKVNQMSIVASHNSYHQKTDSIIFDFLTTLYAANLLPSQYNPAELDYTHPALALQLNQGIRGLELDVWNDPTGGHYYYREGYALKGLPAASNIDALNQPGFKILHIPDFDFNPTNYTFKDAITEIKQWSDAHPNHLPVFINVETEVAAPGDQISGISELTKAIPFDATAADNLDMEVKSVFGNNLDGIITPDQVRGNYASLEQAVLAGNWPKLAQARGKVFFIVNADGNSGDVYMTGHPSLQGRAMFVYTDPGTPEAAFVLMNDPVGSFTSIQKAVSKGYIVRTMSDESTTQARTGDYTKMNAAFGGWAQIVSTDYYTPDARAGTPGWTNYQVRLPGGGVARIDSIAAVGQLGLGAIKE